MMRGISHAGGRRSVWSLLPRIVPVSIIAVLLTAAAVGIVTVAGNGMPWTGCLGPLLVLVGVAVSFRIGWLGLVIVAFAPVAVCLSKAVPEATWSMVCFAALLLAFRGLSGLLTGGVLAALNFSSGALVLGTVNINVNAAASVFAFAAMVGAATGSALRGNVRYRAEAEQRIRDVQAAQTASVERGIAQERLRIAHDLHDSVGHQIAVVNMHLGAAEVHLPPHADQVRADLSDARRAVQTVLQETQQILTVLRIPDEETALTATPGVDAIPGLVERFQHAGMRLEVTIEDLTGVLSVQAGIAAYRIVQESLTNAHRYGDGQASLAIAVDHDATLVRIEVVNLRIVHAPAREPGGGNGLTGMRERAASVGGTVEVRVDGNLFWVTASLPMDPGADA